MSLKYQSKPMMMLLYVVIICLYVIIWYCYYCCDVRHLRRHPSVHPRTPDPYDVQSRRMFNGRIQAWRRQLHSWDPPGTALVLDGPGDSNMTEARHKTTTPQQEQQQQFAPVGWRIDGAGDRTINSEKTESSGACVKTEAADEVVDYDDDDDDIL